MRIIDPKALAATAAERWKQTYHKSDGQWHSWRMKVIYEAVAALGPTPNPQQVDLIIGNRSWTRDMCNEVGCNEDAYIEIGQPPDYDSATANLCRGCLRKAADLL